MMEGLRASSSGPRRQWVQLDGVGVQLLSWCFGETEKCLKQAELYIFWDVVSSAVFHLFTFGSDL